MSPIPPGLPGAEGEIVIQGCRAQTDVLLRPRGRTGVRLRFTPIALEDLHVGAVASCEERHSTLEEFPGEVGLEA